MKAKVNVSFAGHGFAHSQGDVIDLPKDHEWIKCGFCEPVEVKIEPNDNKRTSGRAGKSKSS